MDLKLLPAEILVNILTCGVLALSDIKHFGEVCGYFRSFSEDRIVLKYFKHQLKYSDTLLEILDIGRVVRIDLLNLAK